MENCFTYSDITYMSELTPHPDRSKRFFMLSGCGVQFAQTKVAYERRTIYALWLSKRRKLCAH